MKKLLFITITLLVSHLSFARTITGKITDKILKDPLPGTTIMIKGSQRGTISDMDGRYSIDVLPEDEYLLFDFIGYRKQEIKIANKDTINVELSYDETKLEECVVIGYSTSKKNTILAACSRIMPNNRKSRKNKQKAYDQAYTAPPAYNVQSTNQHVKSYEAEEYASIKENDFQTVKNAPLSTFSIDVDKAGYANVRRFLNGGSLPPKEAVRIEEMINYFNYNYEQPTDATPFSIHNELTTCPWNSEHQLLKVALQGKSFEKDLLPKSNLVFLIDVSGSMGASNKLPLLKSAFQLLVNELRPQDKVSIVVYAGAAGVVLHPTNGNNKEEILSSLNNLAAGGSTAGGEGLKLAYKLAEENLFDGGNNRIILATDGDFNVGQSSNEEMEKLIEEKRQKGIAITVLGFGMGNYKDEKMEIIADKGNGNYAYIDNMQEAHKTLVEEFGGTLFTIAKDVKFQIEFNPSKVTAYRLIGYENRLLENEDFNDDTKDAGEIGAGHTVTALYELIPPGAKDVNNYVKNIDPLKYQTNKQKSRNYQSEILTLKLRYKQPKSTKSQLITIPLTNKPIDFKQASTNTRFAAATAAFGMLLRESKYNNQLGYPEVIKIAQQAKGNDDDGYRAEMVRLMKTAKSLSHPHKTKDITLEDNVKR